MKRILLPTDGSELADYAYALAHKIAANTQAKIYALSIVPAPMDATFTPAGELKNDEGEDYSELEATCEEVTGKLASWVEDKPDVIACPVKIGRIDEDILRCIEERDIDLVVMGTSGAWGMDEVLRGSHATKIMLQSPVPVLTLKCDRSDLELDDLLLVSDFTDQSVLDLQAVKDIQKAFNSRINLLQVNTAKQFETTPQIREKMKKFVSRNQLENVRYHIYCDEIVEQGIINFTSETGIDFVAIGTHQHQGLGRLFRHSISEEVVNHLYLPILAFPVR